ncbi:MAG: beta-ketoacyl synthase chain length factor [Bacteroidales bacterium]|jgi:3-oxoacyl-(acyl-carrier-protein) synthase|nr:beta-ketoacyl synthase chain length factor [Bacteroidales bacterium]
MSVYINSITHISNQEPFSEQWFENPVIYNERYVRSVEPDYSAYIPPMVARRMGVILKRALASALHVIQKTGVNNPDAIITGTGLGCIENTEKFLTAMLDNHEELLTPTFFMQSTHNTISSQIAVYLKCKGYNSTYSHRGTSFDNALLDAFMQFQLGKISTALINGHDELTPKYFEMLEKIGYWKGGSISLDVLRAGDTPGAFAGECSVCFMLTDKPATNNLCELAGIEMLYKPTQEKLKRSLQTILKSNNLTLKDIDAIVTGISGDKANDDIYKNFHAKFFPDKPIVWYKHIFGESYTASGLGLYVAATILDRETFPQHLLYIQKKSITSPKRILVYNHFQGIDHSIALLRR